MINEYVREFIIGRGSYGKVVLYRSTIDGKQYAFKAFYKSRLTRIRVACNETAMTDVLREIAIMKMLEHPNIVNLIEVIDDPNYDKFYMVLEYVEGKSIAAALDNSGVLDEITCRRYMRDIVTGLIYLHDHGIFHGDIKPENLLITRNGSVKIGDFGVSHIFEDGKDELCRSPGTPVFTAPECCYGSSYRGKPADVWAVGITLYCMILGCCPFIGDSLQDTYDMIVTRSLSIPGDLDPDLKDLLQGLLCKEPKLRLTLDEVSVHPWVVKDLGQIPRMVCRCKSGNLQAQNQAANNVNGT